MHENIFASIPVEAPAAVAERVVIHPTPAARVLGSIVVFLVLMSVVTEATGVADQIFMLNAERNVPTYYSTFLLLISSALLALTATLKKRCADRYALRWLALSLIFLYMSVDEMVAFHEMTSPRVERFMTTTGAFYYGSIVYTAALVLIVGTAFIPFLLHLPRKTRVLFAIAGCLYVGGALGLEMIGAIIDEASGTAGLSYRVVATVEETLELTGMVTFIYALLHYLSNDLHEARIQISRDPR
ncbi:MAG: hypothetical protein KY464_01830 [Gemmatimonadetes bacterium]|nr:hypothetical protein [Gemmatimonadota bacterium]